MDQEDRVITEKRFTILETRQLRISEDINRIMTNHLPHIQTELECLNKEMKGIEVTMARWIGGLGVALFLLNLALKFV